MFAALDRRDPIIMPLLNTYCAAGPITWVNHATSPVLKLIGKDNIAGLLYNFTNMEEFLFLSPLEYHATEVLCEVGDPACIVFVKEISDAKPDVDNMNRMDVFVGHFPAGTSVQNMYYWNQMLLNTEFQYFNYNATGNLEHYNSTIPPYYHNSEINVPVHLFAGIYDELADPTDVARLNASLTGSPWVTYYQYPYGHATFMWGKNTSYIYDVLGFFNGSITPSNPNNLIFE